MSLPLIVSRSRRLTSSRVVWSACGRAIEVRHRRGAGGLEPTADIDAGVGFSAIVAGTGGRGRFCIPLEHLELVGVALNHEPMDWVRAFGAANLTSILCYCRHDEAFLDNEPVRC